MNSAVVPYRAHNAASIIAYLCLGHTCPGSISDSAIAFCTRASLAWMRRSTFAWHSTHRSVFTASNRFIGIGWPQSEQVTKSLHS